MTQWISRASVTQRKGRAGRTKPGYCFHLFTSERYQQMGKYYDLIFQLISVVFISTATSLFVFIVFGLCQALEEN